MSAQKGSRALIAGVGMIPFVKPGASEDFDVMGAKAASDALKDAGINISDVQQAYVGMSMAIPRVVRKPFTDSARWACPL